MFDEHTVVFIRKKSEDMITLCSWDILENKCTEVDHKITIKS